MKPSEFVCSRSFRQTVLDQHPVLGQDRPLARLFAWIGFGTWLSEPRRELMLPCKLLATLEEREHLLHHGNYQGFAYLTRFRDEVFAIKIRHHNSIFNKSRTLLSADFNPAVEAAVQAERVGDNRGLEQVYFVGGGPVSPRRQNSVREGLRLEALRLTDGAGSDDAARLLRYLNSRPSHRYTKMLKNMPAALEAASAIPEGAARRHAQNLLLAVEHQPIPYYQPSPRGRTVRIFGYTESVLGLKKSVRRALTPDWTEMDLRGSQAAILASDWDIPSLRAFLRRGDSLWDHLISHLGLTKSDEIKAALKEAVYATAFGMPEVHVARGLSRAVGIRRLGKQFCEAPLIRDILDARTRVMGETELTEGRFNIYGKWLSTKEFDIPSILAQCAQAVEMRLLSPVIDLAETHGGKSGFSLLLWQHDGFAFTAHKREDTSHWVARLQGAVKENGTRLGYEAVLVQA